MLGLLGRAFDGKEVLYVDLRRDKSLIVESFLDRWETSTFPAQIMPAFAHGIIMNPWPWQPEKREDVARFYVETVYANIEEFLKNRNSLTVTLGDSFSFDSFLETIGAEGNLKGARAEWEKIHNPR